MGNNMKKVYSVSDITGFLFSAVGLGVATNDIFEKLFLILSITSVAISIISRIFRGVVVLIVKRRKAKEDGVITNEELIDMAKVVSDTADDIKEDLKGVKTNESKGDSQEN